LALFFTGNVAIVAGIIVHTFAFNFYLRELGFSAVVMGHQVTAMTLGGLAALFPAGVLTDRFGTKAMMLVGVALTTIGCTLGALSRETLWIHAAAAVIGAGAATCRVTWGPVIMRLASAEQRARAFTWNVALLLGGSALWHALAGALPSRTVPLAAATGLSGTQLVLLGGAAVTGLSALCYWSLPLPPAARTAMTVRLPAIPAEVRLLVPLAALWMLGADLVQPFFNIFFKDRFTMTVSSIGALFATALLVRAAVLAGAAEVAKRFGPQRALSWWILAFAPVLCALALAPSLPVAVALFMVQGLIFPATSPLIDQLMLERVRDDQHGVVASWRNAGAEVAGAVGASAGGHLLAATSFTPLLLVAAAVSAASGLLLIAALRAARPAR